MTPFALPVIAAVTVTAGAAGEQVAVPFWLEMLAVVVASISGSLAAREHKLDYMGGIALAVTCGLGGGIIRDVILQCGDVYILNQPLALPISIATATCAFIFPDIVEKPDRLIAVLDIFAVGLYAAVGADKAMIYSLTPINCVMMGFFTAVGGGMMRDVFLGQTPAIFQRGNLYALASIAGGATYVALVQPLCISKPIALVACVAVTMGLRWLSLRFNILSPTEVNLSKVKEPIKKVASSTRSLGSKVIKQAAPGRRGSTSRKTRKH